MPWGFPRPPGSVACSKSLSPTSPFSPRQIYLQLNPSIFISTMVAKRHACGGLIDMSGDDVSGLDSSIDGSTTNITTVTVPASKRLRASKKSRHHQNLPNAQTTPPSESAASSSGPMPCEDPQPGPSSDRSPAMDVCEEPDSSDANNIEVHIGDDDMRSAPVREF